MAEKMGERFWLSEDDGSIYLNDDNLHDAEVVEMLNTRDVAIDELRTSNASLRGEVERLKANAWRLMADVEQAGQAHMATQYKVSRLEGELAEAKGERDEARDQIPHPGDGACDNCGRIPSVDIPTSLCHECVDGVARAETAEGLAIRLAKAVHDYRLVHDSQGGGHIETGRAWDRMRREEQAILSHPTPTDEPHSAGEEG